MLNWFQKKNVMPATPPDIEHCLKRLLVLDELSKVAIDKFFVLIQEVKIDLDDEVLVERLYESSDGLRGRTKRKHDVFALIEIAFASREEPYGDNDHYIRCPVGTWVSKSAWLWWYGLVSDVDKPEKLAHAIELLDFVNSESAIKSAPDIDYLRNHFVHMINHDYPSIQRPSLFIGAPSREERRIEELERAVNDWAVRYHKNRVSVSR